MNPELEQQLIEKYSFLKKGLSLEEQEANGRIDDLYSAFGCEVGSGWYSVIDGLCSELVSVYKKYGAPIDIRPAQIKEKYGRLRFYYDAQNRKKSIHAIDFLGEGTIRLEEGDTDLYKEVRRVVNKWEDISYTVCEECGQPGELRKDLRWIQVLCPECYNKRLSKQKNVRKTL